MVFDGLAVALDLGGTQLRAALVGNDGAIQARAAERTDVAGGPRAVLAQMRRLVAEVVAEVVGGVVVTGVGVCAPGPLDTGTGTVLGIPTLPGWAGFPLRDALADALGLPVTLENDGIAAAYGEWRHGAGRGLLHMVYVTVSTGIGGGVVIDGRLLHGRRGMAGHVGHFPMDPAGPVCSCGAAGCFEALASGSALDRAARMAAAADPAGAIARRAAGHPAEACHAEDAARQGDPEALRIMAREAALLGVGITGLIHLYSPERVILGGGVSAAFDLLDAGIHAMIRSRAMPAFRDVLVVPAALARNSGLVGAATLALEHAGAVNHG